MSATTLIADANGDLYGTTASGGPSNAYVQTNLVSDIAGLATLTDPSLINPWGISRSPTSPFWVSNQGTGTSTLYAVTDGTNVVKVNVNPPPDAFVGIPTTKAGPQGPTGQVNNTNTASFQLTPGTPTTSSRFIFANLNGTISGWAGGQDSTVVATTPGAVYTGLAIDTAQDRLYAANTAAGRIDVFDSSFAPVSLPGAFTDPYLPAGFVPFNVQDIDGKVYVTYVPPGRPAEIAATPGQGVVDVFDENGAAPCKGSSPAVHSPHPGALPLRRPGSGNSVAICWLATSASLPARSMHSTRSQARSRARSRSMSARATPLAGCGPSSSAVVPATVGMPTPFISTMGSTARRMGCSPPWRCQDRQSPRATETSPSTLDQTALSSWAKATTRSRVGMATS